MEIWKDIDGYEGHYMVSNLGRIKSIGGFRNASHGSKQYFEGRIRSANTIRKYPLVTLSVNGVIKSFRVHTLVAKAFIPNPENHKEVNHINGIKTDNRVENLEWCNRSHNNKHMYKLGLAKPVKSWLGKINSPDRSKEIHQYSISGELLKIWPSTSEINRQLGYNKTNIGYCANGKYKQAYGFIWVRPSNQPHHEKHPSLSL